MGVVVRSKEVFKKILTLGEWALPLNGASSATPLSLHGDTECNGGLRLARLCVAAAVRVSLSAASVCACVLQLLTSESLIY